MIVDPEPNMSELGKQLSYPEIARRAELEGRVLVRVLVDTNGKVINHTYEFSLGPLFEAVVDQALKLTPFTPARRNGTPFLDEVTVPIVFRLRGKPTNSFNLHENNIHTLTVLQELDAENRLQYLYWRGKEYFMNRDLNYAQKDYDEYISSNPSNSKPYYEAEFLKIVDKLSPKDTVSSDSIMKKGRLYEDNFLQNKAIDLYTFLIRRDSNDRRALGSRAYLYLKCKEYNKSIVDYRKLIEIDPKDTLAYLNIGWNYYMLGKFNESIENSEKAIELAPGYYTALYNKALAYLRLNQFDTAIAIYKETISKQNQKGLRPHNGAITDLKNLVHDNILAEECTSILKDLFKVSDENIMRR